LYNNSFELVKTKKSRFINRLLENNNKKIYFIVELCKDIIGYSIIIKNSLFLLIVDEAYRNKGIGSKLLEISEQEIKKEGYNEIKLISPNYIFCGVPMDIKSNYYKWFEQRGFLYDWTSFDMIIDLENLSYTANEEKCSLDDVILKKLSTCEIESCSKGSDIVQKGWGQYFLDKNINALIAKNR
jgi:GNAT superfamily N-acetyltransferase